MKFLPALFIIALIVPAQAQQVCTNRVALVKTLTDKYGEQPAGDGIAPIERGSAAMELFVSEKGSFTVFMTYPNGISCLVGMGKSWQFRTIKKGTGL